MTCAQSISGLVVEYIVAIDVTRARFPADAYSVFAGGRWKNIVCKKGEQKECVFAQAAIAQLGERQTEDLKVPGSIPGLGILLDSFPHYRRSRPAPPQSTVLHSH